MAPVRIGATYREDQAVRFIILSRNPSIYSTRRLKQAAKDAGHSVRIIDPTHCYMQLGRHSAVHYSGQALPRPDAIVPRIGVSISYYGTAVVRQWETLGVYTPNPSAALERARDKLRSMQLLVEAGIPIPTTACAFDPESVDDLLSIVGKPPHIIKMVEGTQGRGVVRSDTDGSSRSLVEAFSVTKAHFFLQEFVGSAKGRDIRALVVGGQVVAAMERTAAEGEFRANLHRGATAQKTRLNAKETEIAIASADQLGLGVCGVDLLRTDRGPMVLEVNASPGLKGIEASTGVDVAGAIMEYVAANAQKKG